VSSVNPNIIERKERWARKMSGKAKPATRSENRLPPGQHLTSGFPVLDLGIRPDISKNGGSKSAVSSNIRKHLLGKNSTRCRASRTPLQETR
jgi:hypothetical protein